VALVRAPSGGEARPPGLRTPRGDRLGSRAQLTTPNPLFARGRRKLVTSFTSVATVPSRRGVCVRGARGFWSYLPRALQIKQKGRLRLHGATAHWRSSLRQMGDACPCDRSRRCSTVSRSRVVDARKTGSTCTMLVHEGFCSVGFQFLNWSS
jgi:hypothetical protein